MTPRRGTEQSDEDNVETSDPAQKDVLNSSMKETTDMKDDEGINDGTSSNIEDVFSNPSTFDFLLNVGNSKPVRDLRKISLYLKFDPYVGSPRESPCAELENLTLGEVVTPHKDAGDEKGNAPDISIGKIDSVNYSYSPKRDGIADSTLEETSFASDNKVKTDSVISPSCCRISCDQQSILRRELNLLKKLLIKQENSYCETLRRYKKLVSTLECSLQHSLEREEFTKKQIPNEEIKTEKLEILVEEYEKAISHIVSAKERDTAAFEEQKKSLELKLQSAKGHLVNTQKAYSDLQLKFESIKKHIHSETEKINDLNTELLDLKYYSSELDENYEHLKNEAEAALMGANEELVGMERNHKTETSRMMALTKTSEFRINSLEELLEQLTKENEILMTMCDELINNKTKHCRLKK